MRHPDTGDRSRIRNWRDFDKRRVDDGQRANSTGICHSLESVKMKLEAESEKLRKTRIVVNSASRSAAGPFLSSAMSSADAAAWRETTERATAGADRSQIDSKRAPSSRFADCACQCANSRRCASCQIVCTASCHRSMHFQLPRCEIAPHRSRLLQRAVRAFLARGCVATGCRVDRTGRRMAQQGAAVVPAAALAAHPDRVAAVAAHRLFVR